jgi:ATP adenylyltransferase
MTFDHLWAGWRSEYVASVPNASGTNDGGLEVGDRDDPTECVFCRILADPAGDREKGVVAGTNLSVALLNAYPYASGHLLVMPRRHLHGLGDLTAEESGDLWSVALEGAEAIGRAYSPDGLNLGANLGRAAGAGIPRHLHLHLVPRWTGDTNFMTAVAAVRVLPEPLPRSWEKLHDAWKS